MDTLVGTLRCALAGAVLASTHKTTELAVAMVRAQRDEARSPISRLSSLGLNAKQTERGMVITLDDVLFDTDRAELRASGLPGMAKLADLFERYPECTALIEGFTDSQGSKDAQPRPFAAPRRRGAPRADRSRRVCRSPGHARLRRGLSGFRPIARRLDARLNRRVVIVLSGDDGTVAAR